MELLNEHDLDSNFEPQVRARSNTWPLRPKESTESTSSPGSDETSHPEPHIVIKDANTLHKPTVLTAAPKATSRRNAWGNLSYADLITKAIQSSPEQRLTLSQIYDWMVQNVPYFNDKGDSNSSAGWKNSIRHNLSLHSRFMRVPNDGGAGKSSWWVINPDAKPGKTPRTRRANSMETKNMEKKRHKARKRVEALRAQLEAGGSPQQSGSEDSFFSLSPNDPGPFRDRTSSNASTLSTGRLSPIPALDKDIDDDFVSWEPSNMSAGYPTNSDCLSDNLVDSLMDGMRLVDQNICLEPTPEETLITDSTGLTRFVTSNNPLPKVYQNSFSANGLIGESYMDVSSPALLPPYSSNQKIDQQNRVSPSLNVSGLCNQNSSNSPVSSYSPYGQPMLQVKQEPMLNDDAMTTVTGINSSGLCVNVKLESPAHSACSYSCVKIESPTNSACSLSPSSPVSALYNQQNTPPLPSYISPAAFKNTSPPPSALSPPSPQSTQLSPQGSTGSPQMSPQILRAAASMVGQKVNPQGRPSQSALQQHLQSPTSTANSLLLKALTSASPPPPLSLSQAQQLGLLSEPYTSNIVQHGLGNNNCSPVGRSLGSVSCYGTNPISGLTADISPQLHRARMNIQNVQMNGQIGPTPVQRSLTAQLALAQEYQISRGLLNTELAQQISLNQLNAQYITTPSNSCEQLILTSADSITEPLPHSASNASMNSNGLNDIELESLSGVDCDIDQLINYELSVDGDLDINLDQYVSTGDPCISRIH